MTADTPKPRKSPAQSGAERQRRYRQRKKLHFLEVTEATHMRLQTIRKQKSWSVDQVIAEALTLLEAELQAVAQSARLAEMHKRAVEEVARFGVSQPAKPPAKSRKPKSPEPEEVEGQESWL